MHKVTQCKRTEKQARYSFRNWSGEFACPECGRICWKSLNYLGQNALMCNGAKFKTIKYLADYNKFVAESTNA